jgi:hypothetical protein
VVLAPLRALGCKQRTQLHLQRPGPAHAALAAVFVRRHFSHDAKNIDAKRHSSRSAFPATI